MSESKTRRLLHEALKALRSYQSPPELMKEIEAHLSFEDDISPAKREAAEALKRQLGQDDSVLRDVVKSALASPLPSLPDRVWAKIPPTEPGWYWARRRADGVLWAVRVTVLERVVVEVWTPGSADPYKLEDFDLWSGPIEPPPLPKEKA